MARSWFVPKRLTEATATQVAMSGAGGGGSYDPLDGDVGFTRLGESGRQVPGWTLERARTHSVASYRTNPMGRAIIDTYTAFCVGDSGVTLQCTSPEVRPVAEAFWTDPRNKLGGLQEALLRDHMLQGETALEMLVGRNYGATRFSLVDTTRITAVELLDGNPLWPDALRIRMPDGDDASLTVAQIDDLSGLRTGDALFWPSWKALITDRRGMPFLAPVLDWLDAYDSVLSNLIDRTALARYMVWDVTLKGDADPDEFIRNRGGRHAPASGTTEVHNDAVTWEPKTAETGSFEDTNTSKAILTLVAGGAGLAKTWLADPEDANRATSLTMAEPVRRRVGGIQNTWLEFDTELVRYAVDQAVAAGRLPAEVESQDAKSGTATMVSPSMTVSVTGPEVAAADAQITAEVLNNLAQGLDTMVTKGLLTREAASVATKKAWEQFVGVPYTAELGEPEADVDAIAAEVDAAHPAGLQAV